MSNHEIEVDLTEEQQCELHYKRIIYDLRLKVEAAMNQLRLVQEQLAKL